MPPADPWATRSVGKWGRSEAKFKKSLCGLKQKPGIWYHNHQKDRIVNKTGISVYIRLYRPMCPIFLELP